MQLHFLCSSVHLQLTLPDLAFPPLRRWYQSGLHSQEYVLKTGSSNCQKSSHSCACDRRSCSSTVGYQIRTNSQLQCSRRSRALHGSASHWSESPGFGWSSAPEKSSLGRPLISKNTNTKTIKYHSFLALTTIGGSFL